VLTYVFVCESSGASYLRVGCFFRLGRYGMYVGISTSAVAFRSEPVRSKPMD